MANNRQLLLLLDLPIFNSIKELAELIHIDTGEVKRFVIYSQLGYYYKEYYIKKSTGRRQIQQPGKRLKAIQAWLLRNILDKLSPTSYATAYRPRQGILDGVIPHKENRYFLCMDIKNYFPSIKKHRIEKVFTLIGYSEYAADILSSLCTCKRALPQGGVTSPALSNLITTRLDRRIAGYATRHNMVYTRYADDITLSCNIPWSLPKSEYFIKYIIQKEGFETNNKKTRYSGPQKQCRIIGLIKNNSGGSFGIGQKKKRLMRAIIHNHFIKGNSSPDYPTESSIVGWLSYLKSVDPNAWETMQVYYEKLKP